MKISVPLIAAAVLALTIAAVPASGRERRPGFIEVDYGKENGAQGPDTEVVVFGRRESRPRLPVPSWMPVEV